MDTSPETRPNPNLMPKTRSWSDVERNVYRGLHMLARSCELTHTLVAVPGNTGSRLC